MEAQWMADRAALRSLAKLHPKWTQEELATCLGRSRSFVKKWLKRFQEAPPDDLVVLHWKCQNSGHGVMTHGISPHLKPRQDLGNSGVQKRLQKDRYGLDTLSA